MKVLQFGKYYPPAPPGGIEVVMYNLTEGINKEGTRCDVLCSNTNATYSEEIYNGYNVIRTKSYGKILSTSVSPQLISKFIDINKNYDIIHVHFPDPLANLAVLLAKPKNKVVLHWHSDIVRQRLLLKLYAPVMHWLMKRADAIITTTPTYITCSRHLNPFEHKAVTIPIGVATEHLASNKEEVAAIRKLHEGKKIIFSLGRLIYYKGYEHLIKAASELGEGYSVIIAGEGPLRERLSNMVKSMGLSDRVFLPGHIPDRQLGTYYEACDLFCLPSVERSEAFGIVIIEAMSFGKPVVATKLAGVGWVNQHGVTGINVEPGDPTELSHAIKLILNGKEMYNRFSINCRERFMNFFTREKMAQSAVKLYKNLLGS
ncbi:MAG: glycosyltransferase [Nitrospirae bacterium]|nr:glycosyltransferase [Nitrospirota bacterium]MBF0534782.1 glycosyltransferase [Nitrospirota bacterium]MBF0616456.1 glycosyltransferase [Nitrospirota bacterium]